ncbi:unnamed protein product [Eretmochelys imbricata]
MATNGIMSGRVSSLKQAKSGWNSKVLLRPPPTHTCSSLSALPASPLLLVAKPSLKPETGNTLEWVSPQKPWKEMGAAVLGSELDGTWNSTEKKWDDYSLTLSSYQATWSPEANILQNFSRL